MKSLLNKIAFYCTLFTVEYLSVTTKAIEVVETSWDKANHFFAFFVLYILLSTAYKDLNSTFKIIVLFLFAIQIEIIQYFIPNRYFSLLDIASDFVGIYLGYNIYKFLINKHHFSLKQL